MPFQMIRRYVQNDCRFGPELIDKFQLETGQFRRDQTISRNRLRFTTEGHADISGSCAGDPRIPDHIAEKRRRRRFPVGPCHSKNRRFRNPPGQLDFAEHGNPPAKRFRHDGIFPRHHRRNNDCIFSFQKGRRLASDQEFSARAEQTLLFPTVLYIILI